VDLYTVSWLNPKAGPIVIENAHNVFGIVDDFWFRYITDLGNAGSD